MCLSVCPGPLFPVPTQDDLLNAHLTVEETLRYTAELRMPRTCTPEERTERVTEVLQQVSEGGREGGERGQGRGNRDAQCDPMSWTCPACS
jgi:hypothetical protein